MMELKIMQIDELAAIAPRDILRLFQVVGMSGGRCASAILTVHEH
jgi:hypothetical protein